MMPRGLLRVAAAALVAVSSTFALAAPAPAKTDFDGNGRTDLVWRNSANGASGLWLMNGLAAASTATIVTDPNWGIVTTADTNGDGRSDLVWRNSASGQTAIWLMNGLAPASSAIVFSDANWVVVATGDLNGDGKADLVWRNNATGHTAVWLMNGLATSASAVLLTNASWSVVGTGDFNGDGRADLVWRNSVTGQTALWLMNGMFVVSSAVLSSDPAWSVTAIADLDGDGKSDLVWRHGVAGQTAIWTMNGTALAAAAYVMLDPMWSVTGTGDFNADGKADLYWTHAGNGSIAVWLMNGIAPVSGQVLPVDPAWSVVQAGDFNLDGRTDLVFRNNVNGQSAIWLMNGLAPTQAAVVATDAKWAVTVDEGLDAYRAAARLLAHGTFGSTRAEIVRVSQIGADAWLNEQFAIPATYFTVYVQPMLLAGREQWELNSPAIWRQLMRGNDQLRLRVMYALSQILVVSMENNTVQDAYCGPTSYLDLLGSEAFGNFSSLLRRVALSPIMGEYLNHKGSAKLDAVTGQIPNENFAREVLQLFSIGTVMLNQDGSVVRDGANKPIPTYDQPEVQGFAKAFSGFTYAGQDQTKPWRWLYPDIWDADHLTKVNKACPAWTLPMEPWLATYRSADDTRSIAGPAHDQTAKQLLSYPGAVYSTLPAGQTPAQDLDQAIANIFNHPNVGPFIGRQLIQRLVTSSPSPAYISRVAAAFNNNGSGVRGDMKSVVRAILLDPEAVGLGFTRQPKWGKLREPVIRFVQAHRAFNASVNNAEQYYAVWELTGSDNLAQDVLRAPSVFNFYSPRYAPSASFGADGSSAPEFQITTTDSVAGYGDFSKWGIIGGFRSWDAAAVPSYWIRPDYSYFTGIASDAKRLVDELSLVLAEGMLDPAFKSTLTASIMKIPAATASDREERFKTAFWQILNTPDGLIQK
jgi:uncharacterized protein (DUF1800 family)